MLRNERKLRNNGVTELRRLTAWLNGCRNEGLGLTDPLHGLFDLLTGGIGLQARAQVQSGRQRIQSARILNILDFC